MTTPQDTVATEEAFTAKLLEIQQREETYTKGWQKWLRFFKILLTGGFSSFTNFEELILEQPNDCPIVARYSEIEKFDIPKPSKALSINEIYLNTLRVPHPLAKYIGKSNQLDQVQRSDSTITKEQLQYLSKLEANLNDQPVVFLVHGLGGQLSQFEELILLLSQSSELFAVDLPGFGFSRYFSKSPGKSIKKHSKEDIDNLTSSGKKLSWEAFKTDSVVSLLENIIMKDPQLRNRKIILVAHSMGTHIAIKLNQRLRQDHGSDIVAGLVLLSPPDLEHPVHQQNLSLSSNWLLRFFLYFPFLLSLFRVYDRLGGLYSRSISRMVADSATPATKARQIRWNLDSDSKAWLRYVKGFQRVTLQQLITSLSGFKETNLGDGNIAKVLVLCGDSDKATPARRGFDQIREALASVDIPVNAVEIENAGHSLILEKPKVVTELISGFLADNINRELDPLLVNSLEKLFSTTQVVNGS